MNKSREHITDVIKFSENDQEVWFYSTDNLNDINRYRYYMLVLKNNVPSLEEIDNAMQRIQDFSSDPEDINENSIEYVRFMAIKEFAEKILKKYKKR